MNNKKTFAIASLVLSIAAIVVPFFTFGTVNMDIIKISCFAGLVGAIFAIIFAIVGMKASKGMSIAGLIIGIIGVIFMGIMVLGTSVIAGLENCVENTNGNVTCEMAGTGQTFEVPKESKGLLSDKQYKKK